MSEPVADERIAAVRRFNRFFTREIGVLHEGLLESDFSLTEVRVLYELAHLDEPSAVELCARLSLDPAYLSRILARFDREGLIRRRRSREDGRRSHLSLSDKGEETFAELNRRSDRAVARLLARLPSHRQQALVAAMDEIEHLLAGNGASRAVQLRPPRQGDMAWVLRCHGEVYQGDYGWSDRFFALVARVVADYIEQADPARERCWIAEHEGRRVGSVFLMRESDTMARLRLLLVDPSARGLGVGRRLVSECVATARSLGYERMTLWTNDVLHAARHLYEEAGFRLVREQAHTLCGPELVGQDWELDLRQGESASRA